MLLVYEIVTKDKQRKEIFVDFPSENITDYSDIFSYSLLLDKTIKEMFFSSRLSEIEIHELIDVLYQIEVNELGQIETPDMLANSSTSNLRKLAPLFKNNIKSGISFIQTLEEIKLPKYIIKSLQSAQKGGKLDKTYINIMSILKLKIDTGSKINKILRYPKIVSLFLLSYFFIIMFYIVPATKELTFMMDSSKFPDISVKLYAMSDSANANPIVFIITTLITVFISYKISYKIISKLLNMIPSIRKIGEYRDFSLFFSILSSLNSAGVLMYEAINFSSEIINNEKMRNKFKNISNHMRKEGGTLHERLKAEGFENEKSLMTSVYYGEKSGRLQDYLLKINKNYSERMNNQIDLALEFINPLTMIITITIMIGLYAGVNAPMFTIGSDSF